ncbi:MAG TPA: O-antigen ligase family protein [Gemmatirosa sp.]
MRAIQLTGRSSVAGAGLLLAALVGAGAAVMPLPSLLVAFALTVVTLAFHFGDRLPLVFLGALGVCLCGYTFMGKGFAYVGVPPVFIGEIVLTLGVLAAIFGGGVWPAFRSPVVWLIVAFALWGAARTVPYLGTYGIDALRDATIWGYGLFAILVAGFVLRYRALAPALSAYARWFWWSAFWSPIAGAIFRLAESSIPHVPGQSDIPVLFVKAGDSAVQLAGVAAFVLVGLAEPIQAQLRRPAWLEWAWWGAWFGGLAISGAASRGGLMSVFVAVATVLVLRRRVRWWKPALVSVLFAVVFVGSDVTLNAGQERTVSSRQIAANIRSIFGVRTQESNLDETRTWRLNWWSDIIGYTVHGPYFWTGKGFGVNLADDDGYQGTERGIPNRHPHNVQMMVLAHAGVPGLALWSLLQLTFGGSLLVACVRARREGREAWARVNVWILAFWLAFMANAAFDVFLEGPQGGIWFWSLMGFGIAALETQRQQRYALAAPGERARAGWGGDASVPAAAAVAAWS